MRSRRPRRVVAGREGVLLPTTEKEVEGEHKTCPKRWMLLQEEVMLRLPLCPDYEQGLLDCWKKTIVVESAAAHLGKNYTPNHTHK